MSRNWPRVTSPVGGSNLMTSAPSQAMSCEAVGPAWTCVMSRTRIPESALSINVSPEPSLVHRLCFGAGRIFARVDPDADDRRLARFRHRLAAAAQPRRNLRRVAHLFAVAP